MILGVGYCSLLFTKRIVRIVGYSLKKTVFFVSEMPSKMVTKTVKTILQSLKFTATGVLGNIYRILIENLERSNETIDKFEDLSKIPGFSKAILRNIKKESDRMQASSESDYQEESNIENAKTSIKRKALPSPNISNEKEKRKKKPRKAAMRSSSSSSCSSSEEETKINNAKTRNKRKASPSPNIGNEKEQRRKKPRKAATRSSSSSSCSSTNSLPEPEAHRVRCKVCSKWLLPSEMRQHMKKHKLKKFL